MKDNRYYVGMDVHKATTVISVLDSSGKQIMQQIVETKGSTIIAAVTALRGQVSLTFEEGIHAAWLYDLLLPFVDKIIVCNPKAIKQTDSGNKNDKLDAYRLAELLRLNALKPVYHGQGSCRTLKELAHSYQSIVEDCTRIKNRIKAIYRGRAIASDGESLYHSAKRNHWLDQLEEQGVRVRALSLYSQLDSLTGLRDEAEKLMVAEARKQSAFKIIDSVPTLGPVRASLILATVVTPHRFRSKRQFWSFSGFAVVNRSSSDHEIKDGQIKRVKHKNATRGLNNNFNRTLKNVFKAAANSVCSGPLKPYYVRLCAQGMKPEMARLNLARKIAAITLSIWKKGELFNPDILTKYSI